MEEMFFRKKDKSGVECDSVDGMYFITGPISACGDMR